MGGVDAAGGLVEVGVVEGVAVGLEGKGGEEAVEENALHRVTKMGVAGELQEGAGEFEEGVGAAGRLEGVVGGGKAGEELAGAGFLEGLVGSPAAGCVALGLDHAIAVAGGIEVDLAAVDEPGLERRT